MAGSAERGVATAAGLLERGRRGHGYGSALYVSTRSFGQGPVEGLGEIVRIGFGGDEPEGPTVKALVAELAAARIGGTFNQYAGSPLLRRRLAGYLESRRAARFLLVGEAAGYRGARVSGLPFTSERQLTGSGPAEASATIVHRALCDLDAADDVVLWNVVPTHPGTESSNRPPRAAEVRAGLAFVERLAAGRVVVPVGRVAERALGLPGIRHPSHGGAAAFRAGLAAVLAGRVRTAPRCLAGHARGPEAAASVVWAPWSSIPSGATRSCSPAASSR